MKPDLSVVIPAYNEQDCLGEFCKRLAQVLDDPGLESRIRDHNRSVVRARHTYAHRLRTILETLQSENEKRQETGS